MMKKILTIILVIFAVCMGYWTLSTSPKTVRAFGDLTVDFHVPQPDPIFILKNIKPGEAEVRPVEITNSGSEKKQIVVKGVKKLGVGGDPKLETILEIQINRAGVPIYGRGSSTGNKTLADFFGDSVFGVSLGNISPSQNVDYLFQVLFPHTAGNAFQNKQLVFDLIFGSEIPDHIYIKQVYFKVDSTHGRDPNDEWVELFNPTSKDIFLKNWTLTDNSGIPVIIHANKILGANQSAIISKSASSWRFWNFPESTIKIETGQIFGNGLDQSNEKIILKNPKMAEVDSKSW